MSFSSSSFTRNPKRTMVFSSQYTITSESGVGGSTLAKGLQEAFKGLPYRFVSGGSIMRSFAAGLGQSIEEFAAFNRNHPEEGFDKRCDETICAFGLQNYVVAEGRLPHIFMPHAFRVRLVCAHEVRADRRCKDQAVRFKSREQILSEIVSRDTDDNERYEKLYPGCLWEDADYDLVIDTEKTPKDHMVRYLLGEHRIFLAGLEHSGTSKVVTDIMMPV